MTTAGQTEPEPKREAKGNHPATPPEDKLLTIRPTASGETVIPSGDQMAS